MKKLATLIIAIFVALSFTTSALAEKGASAKAQEHASDEAIFNRVGDWFATIGKSDEEKARIKAERRAQRAAKKAEKEAEKAKREAEKKTKEMKNKAKQKKMDMDKGSKKGS